MIQQTGLPSRQRVPAVLRPVVSRYKDIAPTKLASRQPRAMARECEGNVDKLVQLAFDWRYRSVLHPWPCIPISIRPLQIFEVLVFPAHLVNDLQPRRSLEIENRKWGNPVPVVLVGTEGRCDGKRGSTAGSFRSGPPLQIPSE